MNGYETEEEKVEALRRWWRENGRSVIAGVVIAIVGVVGWNQWQGYQRDQALAASQAYEAVVADLQQGNAQAASRTLERLRAEHGDSVYAVFASLRVAAKWVEQGDPAAAEEALRWAVDHAGSDGVRQLARLRLAQVLDALERREEALAVLEPVPEGPFSARFHELVGDVRAAVGERDAAVSAYREAVSSDPLNRRRGLIEMKIADLGAEVEPAS